MTSQPLSSEKQFPNPKTEVPREVTTSSPSSPKSNESFVVLTQSQITKPSIPANMGTASTAQTVTSGRGDVDVVGQRLRVSAKLFEAISGRSDIDYPVCTECADILLETISGKQVEVKKERDGYLDFIKGLQNEGQVTAEEKAAAEKELDEVSYFSFSN